MTERLLEILRKLELYKSTGSESIRQELCRLELKADKYWHDNGQPEVDKGCLNFIHKILSKVVV